MKAFNTLCTLFSVLIMGMLITSFYTGSDLHVGYVIPVKMSVFYVGVDNPVWISACKMKDDQIMPVISNGSISRTAAPGSYVVRINGGVDAIIDIMTNDSTQTLGSYKFRIKRIPDPVAYVGNLKADGIMSGIELQNISGIFARMENFDFDVKFNVVSFEMSLFSKGKWKTLFATGPAFTPEMKADIATVVDKDKVLFSKVIVKGPDGTLRKIPGVIIDVK
ncbi:MAG: GldM family protein [Bacteroidia bacterium]